MDKLYPPIIEGKLPPFAIDVNSSTQVLNIPLQLNRAVGLNQISAMSLVIKTVSTSKEICTVTTERAPYLDDTMNSYIAHFDVTEHCSLTLENGKICPGQYYKVQLAFYSSTDADNPKETLGFYSTIGVLKCTTLPNLSIPRKQLDGYHSEYVGIYDQSEDGYDGTEKVYSYYFNLLDENEEVVQTSGVQLHNSATDTETNKSTDSWYMHYSLKEGITYTLEYGITTMNGLTHYTRESLICEETIAPDLPFELIAIADNDEGCNKLYFRPHAIEYDTEVPVVSGSFAISRSSSEDNYESWFEIYRFSYDSVTMTPRYKTDADFSSEDILIWEDFTTQQGISYRYSLQQFNANGLYSSRLLNVVEELDVSISPNPRNGVYHTVFTSSGAEVLADFEDMFLFDGERQLKLRFNPKVTSFKTTLLESKLNTLGGKFPFIFRNGSVEFKEFPVSGLLSLISDGKSKFMDGIQQMYYAPRSITSDVDSIVGGLDTDLTTNNIYRERLFKLSALNWLNDGKPKLFRSPAEGNYIVRLMNVSLAPNDALGRMLHTVSAQATEVADCTFENLTSYGFVKAPLSEQRHFKVAQIQSKELQTKTKTTSLPGTLVDKTLVLADKAYYLNFTGGTEGTIVGLVFDDVQSGMTTIEIGATGCYYVMADNPVVSITLIGTDDWSRCGQITYCYYDDSIPDAFNNIIAINVSDAYRQFIGPGIDINLIDYPENLSISLTDVRRQVGRFSYLAFQMRTIKNVFNQGGGKFSYDTTGTDILSGSDWNEHVIYRVYKTADVNAVEGYIYDSNTKQIVSKTPDYQVFLNNEIIDLGGNPYGNPPTLGRVNLTNIYPVETLRVGSGVVVEMGYRQKEITYAIESEDADIIIYKSQWETADDKYKDHYYFLYVQALEAALEREKQAKGE